MNQGEPGLGTSSAGPWRAGARRGVIEWRAALSIESFNPVVHLVNGGLSYANSNQLTQPQVWEQYFDNTQLSAANRPWMPTLGNHENEPGNGPQGYLSYQTRFTLPKNGSGQFEGNWYSFQVGFVLAGHDHDYERSYLVSGTDWTRSDGFGFRQRDAK